MIKLWDAFKKTRPIVSRCGGRGQDSVDPQNLKTATQRLPGLDFLEFLYFPYIQDLLDFLDFLVLSHIKIPVSGLLRKEVLKFKLL